MEKKFFDIERLKRRVRYCQLSSSNSDDLFDKAYSFAMGQVLGMIDFIENDYE